MPSYTSTSTVTPWSISSDYRIAAFQGDLVNNNHHIWLDLSISYSFPAGPSYFNNGTGYGSKSEVSAGWSPLTSSQQQAAKAALAAWADVANITFYEVDDDLNVGDLRFALTSAIPTGSNGHAYPPAPNYPEGGDVWITSRWAGLNFGSAPSQTHGLPFQHDPVVATRYMTLLHEIGHSLGFSHPFTENNKTRYTAPLPLFEESQRTSVMSYAPLYGELGAPIRGIPTTPMVYDILTAQFLYGANLNHNRDDTVYRFDMSDVRLETIWDAGGNDTIVASNNKGLIKWDSYATGHRGVQIDLRPAQGLTWTDQSGIFGGPAGNIIGFIGDYAAKAYVNEGTSALLTYGLTYLNSFTNIYIAYYSQIENAVGTDANDKLIGNTANNRLTGLGGQDRIDGQEGIDTAVYIENAASYTVVKTVSGFDVTANFTVSLATNPGYSGLPIAPYRAMDKLQNVERIEFADRSLAFDLAVTESAGKAARIVGALLDTSMLTPEVAGIAISLFDSGQTMVDIAQLILNHPVYLQNAGSSSNAALVTTLFTHIANVMPTTAELNQYVGMLDRGEVTQAQLAVSAAESTFNASNINLVGLQSSGLVFTPYLG